MKYLKNGHAVEIVTELPDNGGFVVETYSEDCETGEAYLSGDKKIVTKVFDSPPVAHIAKEYTELQAKLSDIRKQVAAAEKNARDAMPEWNRLTERLSQVPGLQRIADFIDGKFTHAVVHQYGKVEILSGDDLRVKEDTWKRLPDKIKLITLFGDADGNMTWNISKYKCESSSNYDCILCFSQEDAMKTATELIRSELDDDISKDHGYCSTEFVESAKRLGIELDEKYLEFNRNYKLKAAKEHYDSMNRQFLKAKEQLDKLSVVAKTA